VKVALCQFNPTVGAVHENAWRLFEFVCDAKQRGAKLMFAPEMALCGYPPKDLMGNADFHQACQAELDLLAQKSPVPMILGAPDGRYNAVFYCANGKAEVVARKQLLPNYQVFDDKRYFTPGDYLPPWTKWGITICEDAWNDEQFWQNRRYELDPVHELVTRANPDILVTLMASPFEAGKAELRERMFAHMAKRYSRPVWVVGQVGANDGLIFDGGSMLLNAQGEITQRATSFEEELILCEV
jgi:predicted amidohydrolase